MAIKIKNITKMFLFCHANWRKWTTASLEYNNCQISHFWFLFIQKSNHLMFETAILLSWFFPHFFPILYFFAFISCWYCCIYFTECRYLFYLLIIDCIIYSRLAIKALILAIHYIFRSLLKVEKWMCGKMYVYVMSSLLLILFIHLSAIEKIMEKK